MEFQKNSESPPIYTKWVAISMIASGLSRKVWHKWDGLIYPNFFICLVGPSGEARKGTAMRPGGDFLDEQEIYTAAESTTRESLIEQLELGGKTFTTPDGEVLVYSAITVYSEEFTVFLNHRDERFLADLCDLFDCKRRWRYQTKRSGSNHIRNVFMNLIGATTPKTLRESLPNTAVGGGLMSRIILVYADKGRLVIFPDEHAPDHDLLRKLAHDYQDIQMLAGEFTFDEGWRSLYERWYPKQKEELVFNNEYANSYSSRRSLHLRKLCMICNVSRGGQGVITAEDFKRAHSLLIETEANMGQVFLGVGRNELAEVQAAVMMFLKKTGGATFSDIARQFWQDATRDEMSVIVSTLELMKMIDRSQRGDDTFFKPIIRKEQQ